MRAITPGRYNHYKGDESSVSYTGQNIMRTLIALLLLASPVHAADPVVHHDLAYAEPKNERQTLDVYAPTEGKDHPIVFWIHGGGWTSGDKSGSEAKARRFVEKGFVFVPTNYRFAPQVTLQEMTGGIPVITWRN